MKIRTYILVLWLCSAIAVSLQAHAQEAVIHENAPASYGHEHTNVLKLRAGYSRQLDTYLSPLAFHGWQVGLGNEWWQSFRSKTGLSGAGRPAGWGHVGRVDIAAATYTNTARSNSFYGLQIAAGWGAFYCWQWLDNRLKLHLGPYLEAGFAARDLNGNVNKPLSFDIAVDLMAMSGISWSFYGNKTSYRLNYLVRTNLLGFDYLPHYWQSYYEITEGVPGMARCSGHWNHHSLKHELTLDMQFSHSTWRIGATHLLNDYGTADLHFSQNTVGLVIACIWKYRLYPNARL
ncbi:MAG: DUF3316 domain-containing protein [Paludibacteraceae bacterium]|nr:DUF3316 domain-containing protein [Paludibacteraceae bacterium]